MSTKPKRPALLDLDSLLIKAPAAAAQASSIEPSPPTTPVLPTQTRNASPSETFRTSVYFSRAVHDKLREIAFEERKSVTDLINEGLDHVLKSRNYQTTKELRSQKR